MLARKEDFTTNLIKSVVGSLACLSLWTAVTFIILAFIDVAVDPVPPGNGRSEGDGALLIAVFCLTAFWGAAVAGHFIHRSLNIPPARDEDGSIIPLNTNPTLLGWLVGSAVFFLAIYTIIA